MALPEPISRFRRAAEQALQAIHGVGRSQDDLIAFLHTESWRSAIQKPPYDDPLRLLRHGYKAYSECDEDGIIAEIFRRIGTTNRVFLEFGVGDGLANNTLNLLVGGWRGYWIECAEAAANRIREGFADAMAEGRLGFLNEFVTAESINEQIQRLGIPGEIDLLSIDIDGNDYWVWKALEATRPRVVVIEYNATLHPPLSLVMQYQPRHEWNATNYFGASLKALEKLGREKGYSLVACNYSGVNAFFVRTDLVGEHFAQPFTAEMHYEPPRYLRIRSGHPPAIGPYVEV